MLGLGPIKSSKKMVGAYVSRPLSSHIALIALSAQKSTTQLLISVLSEYVSGFNRNDLVLGQAEQCVKAWKETLEVNRKSPKWSGARRIYARWGEYKFEVGEALQKKGVGTPDIYSILQKMDELADVPVIK